MLSGRTPLEVWEADADQIRWVEDPGQPEQSFYGEVERLVRNDSTVQWRGVQVLRTMRKQCVADTLAFLESSVADGWVESQRLVSTETLSRVRGGTFSSSSRETVAFDKAPQPKDSLIKTRIVWIIFDELSQDQVYDQRRPDLRLPNFDRLRLQSVMPGMFRIASVTGRVWLTPRVVIIRQGSTGSTFTSPFSCAGAAWDQGLTRENRSESERPQPLKL